RPDAVRHHDSAPWWHRSVLRRVLTRLTVTATTLAVEMTRWQPTWGRVGAATGALFLIILAFLAGRVRGGHDPALRAQPAAAPALVAPAAPDTDPPVTQAS